MKTKTIAITGSSGFVGKHLINEFRAKDYDIIKLDIREGIDLTNWEKVNEITRFDVVIHLAARVFVPDSYSYPREFYSNNIVSTLNMLELCRKFSAKMIYISSYVYGKPQYLPIDEKHPTNAFNPYCQSKLISEELCRSYNKDFDVPVIIFRPFNIYGPGQNENFLIPLIQKQIKENAAIQLKDPRPKRDFIHVDDAVDAYYKAIEYNKTDFEIFNLGSGISYSVEEIAKRLAVNSGKNVRINFSKEYRENEVLDTVADIRKIKNKLNWNCRITLDKGIASII